MRSVLNTVRTVSEGSGLEKMTQSIVKRYEDAREPPPDIIYVDRDCCSQQGTPKTLLLFDPWHCHLRLDIWHYMRRFAAGMTTDNHPLYGIFLSPLSCCIFEWSAEDRALLRHAKKSQIQLQLHHAPTDAQVSQAITKNEMSLHCRRQTRGPEKTRELIVKLLSSMWTLTDSLGVPLIDRERMAKIWEVQQKHLPCIQDPPGHNLYTRTGQLKKGGITLPTYRCARGSVSVESFHLHQNRFIPGECGHIKFQISQHSPTY